MCVECAIKFLNESDTRDAVYASIRETYDGPLILAEDNLVWNITKDSLRAHKVVSDDEAWSQPGPNKPKKPDHTVPGQLSKEMLAGVWDISSVTANMIKEFKAKYKMK